jgi:hypothetical protein
MNVLPPLVVKLLVSHAVALVAGVLLAVFLPHRNVAHETLKVMARAPLQAGTDLAFRFGEPEHARALIQRALAAEPTDSFEWMDAMNLELHLAVIDGEQIPESGRSEHIQKAAVACNHAGNGGCEPDQLREAARALLR